MVKRIQSILKTLQLDITHRLFGEGPARRKRARRLATLIQSELNRLGFTRKITSARGEHITQRVHFAYPLLLTAEEIWCPIDAARLPTAVRTDDLREPGVLKSLSERCSTEVRIEQLANGRVCLVARLASSRFPDVFSFNAFKFADDAAPLAIPVGLNSHGEHVAVDLLKLKHLLIAGATGGGKTTFVHSIVTSLISRNTADELEIRMIDLKRTEANLYRPLAKRGGIIGRIAVAPDEAIDLLDDTYREIVRRNTMLENLNATSLNDLEQSTGQRLKRIVLICDEFAVLTTDRTGHGKNGTVGSWAQLLMTRIAALGRSAGVSIIIATQMINKEVLSSMIRANFENRLSFSTADWRQSQLIIESSAADGLPAGRAVLKWAGQITELQTCLITARQVRLEVTRITEYGPEGRIGDTDMQRFVRDAKLLITIATERLGGDFARARILALDGIRGQISQERFNDIAGRLEKDGVLLSGGPRRPRTIAKTFANKPELIDALYLPGRTEIVEIPTPPPTPKQSIDPTIDQTISVEQDNSLLKQIDDLQHQDAVDQNTDATVDTVYSSHPENHHAENHHANTDETPKPRLRTKVKNLPPRFSQTQ